MPGTVSIGEAYEPVEVDLWGKPYETVPATRSLAIKGAPLIDKLNDLRTSVDYKDLGLAEDADPAAVQAAITDELVKAMGKLLDLKLRPVEGTRKASTLVREKWNADEVTLAQLETLLEDIGEADRPT